MITEDYISFETAKLLKDKGFDEDCFCYYIEDNICFTDDCFHNSEIQYKECVCTAPTLQMAMKWLREVHNIVIVVDYDYECTDTSYCYKIYKLGENGNPEKIPITGVQYDYLNKPHEHIVGFRDYERSYSDYRTYEEACEAAIKYCLESLL